VLVNSGAVFFERMKRNDGSEKQCHRSDVLSKVYQKGENLSRIYFSKNFKNRFSLCSLFFVACLQFCTIAAQHRHHNKYFSLRNHSKIVVKGIPNRLDTS
jgi:hypothetical protein